MNVQPALAVLTLTIAGFSLAVGPWLLRRGLRGRRVGNAPYCRACGYNLVGGTGDRCSECGADLSAPAAVVIGRRERSRRTITLGAVLTLVAAVVVGRMTVPPIRNVDLYRFKPTGFVLEDLASPTSPNRSLAWQEIDRRLKGGSPLSAKHHDRLVEIALAEQGATTASPTTGVSSALVDWLGREALAGTLTQKQKAKFYEQCIRLTMEVRPVVIDGDPAPYRINRQSRGPSSFGGPWWTRVSHESASIDGGTPVQLGGSSSSSGLNSGGSSGSTVNVKGLGKHELKVVVRVEVWTGPDFADTSSPKNALQDSRDVTLTGTVEVVPDSPERRVGLAPADPAVEAQVRASLAPRNFEVRHSSQQRKQLSGEVEFRGAPVDVAVQVIARVDGKEYSLSTMTQAAGSKTSYMVNGDYDGPGDLTKMDLIFRPDAKAARRTVDLTKIWGAELEYKDVPVKPLKQP